MDNAQLKRDCEAVLKEPNADMEWACLKCGKVGGRRHWVAEHVLGHLREEEIKEKSKPKTRFDLIEIE